MNELINYQCIDFKKLLILKGKSLKLSDEKIYLLLLMMTLKELGVKPLTPNRIKEYSSLSTTQIDQYMLELINDHYLDRRRGLLDFKPLERLLLNQEVGVKKEISLVEAFEDAFGRTLSSTDIECINDFKRSGYEDEMILLALKEAVKSNVQNFRYIERILENWSKYGVKTRKEEKEKTFDEKVMNYEWWNE